MRTFVKCIERLRLNVRTWSRNSRISGTPINGCDWWKERLKFIFISIRYITFNAKVEQRTSRAKKKDDCATNSLIRHDESNWNSAPSDCTLTWCCSIKGMLWTINTPNYLRRCSLRAKRSSRCVIPLGEPETGITRSVVTYRAVRQIVTGYVPNTDF